MTDLDVEIILALADCDMSVARTGQKLYMHQNTVKYHLAKVKKETGLNPKCFYDLVKLLAMIERED